MNNSPQTPANRPDHTSPQFHATENFIPLSFSSPINQKESPAEFLTQNRNPGYFSTIRDQYQRNTYRNRHQQNNRRSYDNRQHHNNSRKSFNRQSNDPEAHHYFHPSMLEDPWKELIERNKAKELSEKDKTDDESHMSDKSLKTSAK